MDNGGIPKYTQKPQILSTTTATATKSTQNKNIYHHYSQKPTQIQHQYQNPQEPQEPQDEVNIGYVH